MPQIDIKVVYGDQLEVARGFVSLVCLLQSRRQILLGLPIKPVAPVRNTRIDKDKNCSKFSSYIPQSGEDFTIATLIGIGK